MGHVDYADYAGYADYGNYERLLKPNDIGSDIESDIKRDRALYIGCILLRVVGKLHMRGAGLPRQLQPNLLQH